MTPQELMDLPGYGKAEEYLRRTNQWELTKEEIIESALSDLSTAMDDAMNNIEDVWRKLDT